MASKSLTLTDFSEEAMREAHALRASPRYKARQQVLANRRLGDFNAV